VREAVLVLSDFDDTKWESVDALHNALNEKLVDEMGLKPRLAFTPIRVAITGKRVSPPLFDSMVILGKVESLRRMETFAEKLA
jgi:glutamyl-tRNA synthetase